MKKILFNNLKEKINDKKANKSNDIITFTIRNPLDSKSEKNDK